MFVLVPSSFQPLIGNKVFVLKTAEAAMLNTDTHIVVAKLIASPVSFHLCVCVHVFMV